jgi:endonuclease III
MINAKEKIVDILIEKGNELFKQPYKYIEFTKNKESNELLNNLNDFPHAFFLACVMDRQIKAERAWLIPYSISEEIKSFKFSMLLRVNQKDMIKIFKRKSLHRFNGIMGRNFYLAVHKIHNNYQDDASNIWKGNPRSAVIVRRLLEFEGVGVKIATMTANILARDFKIPMKDYINIDISPDVHVKRVFKRLGLISKDASNDELVYCARELNPMYPGIFDLSCWEIGRNWCRPNKPICRECYLNSFCNKKNVKKY